MSSPLSGFTAVPNPQMLAFMGAQSFIMMYQAGEGWQYGKRKISAMSNEDFNKLTPEIVMQKQAVVLKNSLDTIQKSMNDMTPMISTIVEQYGDFIHEIIKSLPQIAQNIVGGEEHEHGEFSTRAGTPAFITPITPYIPKFVDTKTVVPHGHEPVATIPFGPQLKERQEVEKKIQKDTRRPVGSRDLSIRQRQLESAGAVIDVVRRKIRSLTVTMGQIHTKQVATKSGSSLENFYRNKRNRLIDIRKPLLLKLLDLTKRFHSKYGVWYASSVTLS